ncbi:non-ribosomal peptide synthetase [Phytomonospora endophytica]|uniref:Amino acid adenylation domain-containing protein n=1 Tax=Phytomonospora endophytica TaxID=714109 RepID=A0A841FXT4_9ACTN|nr:non-ribosomal peptide synthetase [Phytomonospora endophytica]MBB6039533.1 amino acid adenylation domain-containing protein [Phytomonospora endophytica]GIG70497.1 non-ribosomal peptide synthetase [Phytomonospora endophytica]
MRQAPPSPEALLAATALVLAELSTSDTVTVRIADGPPVSLRVADADTLADLATAVHAPPGDLVTTWDLDAEPVTPGPVGVDFRHARGEAGVTVHAGRPGDPVDLAAVLAARITRVAALAPDTRCAEVDPVPASERHLVLDTFGRGAPAHPPTTFTELWDRALGRDPSATFLIDGDTRLTYAEADTLIDAMSRGLTAAGAGRGDRVAICASPGARTVCALYAILRTGAAYVPVDPKEPPARRTFILGDVAPAVVVTDLDDLTADAPVLALAELGTGAPGPVPAHQPRPSDPVYVMYTSGTTGRPKGTVLTHAGVTNLVLGLAERFGLTPADRVLWHTRFSFDASVSELLLPVAAGTAIVIAPAGGDVGALVDLVEGHRVTLASMVPGVIDLFCELAGERTTLAPLRTVFSVGEALPAEVAEKFHRTAAAHGSAAVLENLYGPTETSVFATATPVPRDVGRITVGRPLTGVTVRVLGPGDRPAGIGAPGEICVAGTGVGLGYLNRPELHAEKFVADPFGDGVMYRTGDIGRWLPSGELDYLGRADDQVKVRGHRIELGEIETALAGLPGVDRAACCAITTGGATSLHALLVTGEPATVTRARAHLTEAVPAHMVPATFTRVDALARNANGKLDRKALARLVERRPRHGGLAPTGEREELLAAAVGGVLGTDPVFADDTFLDLGGDSLNAVLVTAALRGEGAALPPASLLGGGTIAEAARDLTTTTCAAADPWRQDGWEPFAWRPDPHRAPAEWRHVLARTGPVEAVLPLTPMQQSIAYSRARDDDGTAYVVQQIYDTTPDRLSPEALRAALADLAAAHPALRSRVLTAPDDGRQLHVVTAGTEPPLTVLTVDDPKALDEAVRAERLRPFGTDDDSLVRLTWATCGTAAVLIVTYHHLVLDGWSQDLIVGELVDRHDAHRAGRVPADVDVEAVVRRYGDAIRAQAWAALEVDEAYWSALLSDEDAPPPARWRSRGSDETAIGSVSVPLAPDVPVSVASLAERLSVTASAVVEAAFAVTLQQYAGARDVVYGKVVTARDLPVPGIAETAALVINTVAVRARATAATTAAELIGGLYRQSLDTFARARGPLTGALRAGGRRRGELNALYVHEGESQARSRTRAAGLRLRQASTERTDAEVTLVAGEEALTVLYDGRRLTRADMTLLLRRMAQTLDAMTADPGVALHAIPALLPGEVRPPGDATGTRTRVDVSFRKVAAARADRPALVKGEQVVTYAQLDEASDRVVGALRDAGVAPGASVGVPATKSVTSLVALLGVVKAGCVYVPLDPALPRERLAYLVSSSGASAVVATAADTALTEPFAGLVVDPEGAPGVCEPVPGSPEDPVYVMYTSGTTGRPKGVAVAHRAVTGLVEDVDYVGLSGDSVILQTGALDFDAATFEIWGAWLNGGTLVLDDLETKLDTAALGTAIRRHGVTHMWLTSSLFNLHVEADPTVFEPLAELLIGGERLSPEHVRRFYAANHATVLINGYGPTETTTFATTHRIERDVTDIPIGRPLPRAGVHVIGDDGPRGVGLPGELWITGDGLALGYVNDPDLTAERFVDLHGTGRAYRTGDLVAWNGDGTLGYLGRADDQVKVRGFRVEPEEVSAALRTLPGVDRAAVIARDSTAGARELVAFVVGAADLDPAAARTALGALLPAYAVPAEVRRLDNLPLTPSGKVDRRALERLAPRTQPAPPPQAGEGLDAVRAAFAHACGSPAMGAEDNFFEHGGDSLKAMRLVGELRRAGLDATIRDVLTAATPAALHAILSARAPLPPPGAPADTGGTTASPMSAATVRVYTAQQRHPGSLAYNVPFAVAFKGRADKASLARFLTAFTARHEALHSRYEVRDGRFEQSPVPGARCELETTDATGEPTALLRAFARPFPLDRPPLIRAALSHGPEHDVLLVDAHHIAFDGAALDIFHTELAAHLDGTPLPKATPYSAFARALAAHDTTADLAYWRKELTHPPAPVVLAMSADGGPTRLGVAVRHLPAEVRDALAVLAAGESATPFALYTAALAVLLQKYTMLEDLVIGTPVDNRAVGEFDGVVGMGVNTVALRVRPADTATVRELLREVRDTVLAAFEHQVLPFDELLTAVTADGHPAPRDLLRVMLAYRDAPREHAGTAVIGPISLEPKFDLELTVTAAPGGDVLGLEYSTGALDADAAELMTDHLVEILTAFPGAADASIAELGLT